MSKFHVEQYDREKHGGEIMLWWAVHSGAVIDLDAFSADGAVAYYQNQPVAACWAYEGKDSKSALIGWGVTNPGATLSTRLRGMRLVIDHHVKTLTARGLRYILAFSSSGGLSRQYQHAGFTVMPQHDFLAMELPVKPTDVL